jgi:hypothetical protein
MFCLAIVSNVSKLANKFAECKYKMNKAELKAKADEYFDCVNYHTYADTEEDLREDVTEAYIAGYEARNEEVKILKRKSIGGRRKSMLLIRQGKMNLKIL